MATSGIGNSINSSWDHENYCDTVVNFRPTPRGTGITTFMCSMGESIDLYRDKDEDETGSDGDLDGDEFEA